jgi:hypothetical protein
VILIGRLAEGLDHMKDQYGISPEAVAGTDPWMDSPDKDRSAITDEVVESLGRGRTIEARNLQSYLTESLTMTSRP